jgi:hypothetical protein
MRSDIRRLIALHIIEERGKQFVKAISGGKRHDQAASYDEGLGFGVRRMIGSRGGKGNTHRIIHDKEPHNFIREQIRRGGVVGQGERCPLLYGEFGHERLHLMNKSNYPARDAGSTQLDFKLDKNHYRV